MSYRPEVKTDQGGATVDFPLDAETIRGKSVGFLTIANASGTLTSAQYSELTKDIALIKYGNKVFYKEDVDSSNKLVFVGKTNTSVISNTYTRISQDIVTIDTTTRAYEYVENALINTYTNTQIDTKLSGKQDTISDLSTIRSGASKGATAVQPSDLSTVATSGSYNDLSNKPTIPTALSQLSADSTHRLVTDTEKSTWNGKQNALVSGTNIKTINGNSILGSGNLTIGSGIFVSYDVDEEIFRIDNQTKTPEQMAKYILDQITLERQKNIYIGVYYSGDDMEGYYDILTLKESYSDDSSSEYVEYSNIRNNNYGNVFKVSIVFKWDNDSSKYSATYATTQIQTGDITRQIVTAVAIPADFRTAWAMNNIIDTNASSNKTSKISYKFTFGNYSMKFVKVFLTSNRYQGALANGLRYLPGGHNTINNNDLKYQKFYYEFNASASSYVEKPFVFVNDCYYSLNSSGGLRGWVERVKTKSPQATISFINNYGVEINLESSYSSYNYENRNDYTTVLELIIIGKEA